MQRIEVCVLFAYLALCSQAKAQGGIITTVAGSGIDLLGGFSGDGGPAASALLNIPAGVAVDASGNLFIADSFNNRIRKVSASGIITTVAGSTGLACTAGLCVGGFSGDGGPATSAVLNIPTAIAVDTNGNLFIVDSINERIRKVSANGLITTVAGNGSCCFSGDGGPATAATFNSPAGVAVDTSGNLFIADFGNGRIRKVSTNGIITTVAGNGTFGFSSGDGGPATVATLVPKGVAVDASGNLFIADTFSNQVRKVSASGIITTIAGKGTTFGVPGGFSGDGGPATLASLHGPAGVAVDASGNLFIADDANDRIREVSAKGGIITTVVGGGAFDGTLGDGGPATAAPVGTPNAVAVDVFGNLFISSLNRIREVRPVSALGAVQNAASLAAGAVSPGEVVVLYGAGMGPAALATSQVDSITGLLATTLAGTTVLFNGTPAPIIYTSANQVSAIVPYEIAAADTVQVYVNYQGRYVAAGPVTAALSAPAIFTVGLGTGQAAALNQDGSVNSASNPAAALSTIVLYLTGEGQTNPPGADGRIAAASPLPAPVLPVTVRIGGQPAVYAYAGAAPGEVAGVMQINATIPAGVTGNAVAVSVQIGTVSTQSGVTIAVQ